MPSILSGKGLKLFRRPVYALTGSAGSVNEGGSVTFTLTTDGPDGTFYWTNSGTTDASDFSDSANNGSFVTVGGVGTFTRTLAADVTTEGAETIIMNARTNSVTGTIVATSQTVTVADTSTAPLGLSPDWIVGPTLGVGGANFTTLAAALASPSVVNGNYIKVLPGTYTLSSTLTVSKEVYIGGTPGSRGTSSSRVQGQPQILSP